MNFYDLFKFLVRFSFANIVQLCLLAKISDDVKWYPSVKAKHLIVNLESAKDIAIKMNFTCLSKNHMTLDFRSILKDPMPHLQLWYSFMIRVVSIMIRSVFICY